MGQTETKVAQVTLKSENDRSRNVNIDRPKDNLTLNQIKAAFAPAINGGWLLDNYGDTITSVAEAKYNQVIKTQINGESVTISPSSLSVSTSIMSKLPATGTLTVTGGEPTSFNFSDWTKPSNITGASANYDNGTITVKVYVSGSASDFPVTGNLKVFFDSQSVTVPITVSAEA